MKPCTITEGSHEFSIIPQPAPGGWTVRVDYVDLSVYRPNRNFIEAHRVFRSRDDAMEHGETIARSFAALVARDHAR